MCQERFDVSMLGGWWEGRQYPDILFLVVVVMVVVRWWGGGEGYGNVSRESQVLGTSYTRIKERGWECVFKFLTSALS